MHEHLAKAPFAGAHTTLEIRVGPPRDVLANFAWRLGQRVERMAGAELLAIGICDSHIL